MYRSALVLIASLASLAHSASALAQVAVSEPWVRATVAEQKATGAFMQLTAAQDARLVSASSPIAGIVEVHEMAMEKDVMKMRKLANGLALPAGKAVELKPGGFHVMLMDLKQQIKAGDAVPMTLVTEDKTGKQTRLEIKAMARPLATPTEGGKMEMMHKH